MRVEKYFEGTNISAYAGPPPEPEHSDYCWGGCPGAIEEAIEILRLFDKEPTPRCRTCTSCSAPTTEPFRVTVGNLKNPYSDRSNMLTFSRGYFGWKARVAFNALQHKSYQANAAFAERGQAAPELEAVHSPTS